MTKCINCKEYAICCNFHTVTKLMLEQITYKWHSGRIEWAMYYSVHTISDISSFCSLKCTKNSEYRSIFFVKITDLHCLLQISVKHCAELISLSTTRLSVRWCIDKSLSKPHHLRSQQLLWDVYQYGTARPRYVSCEQPRTLYSAGVYYRSKSDFK